MDVLLVCSFPEELKTKVYTFSGFDKGTRNLWTNIQPSSHWIKIVVSLDNSSSANRGMMKNDVIISRVVGYWFCYQNTSSTTDDRVNISTVLLLEDMGADYTIVRMFTVEAIQGRVCKVDSLVSVETWVLKTNLGSTQVTCMEWWTGFYEILTWYRHIRVLVVLVISLPQLNIHKVMIHWGRGLVIQHSNHWRCFSLLLVSPNLH